jgi:predicted DNA-binding transcriptional regulator AlpA
METPPQTEAQIKPPKLLSKKEVMERVPVSYTTLWDWMQKGLFPRSRELGDKACWLSSEIDDWIVNRPIRPLKGDSP